MRKTKLSLTSAGLHILAMGLMLTDHLWATVVPNNGWMTCLGRLAFPIFAFMIAEGFAKTTDRKAYAKRLLCLALISEIPMNLMTSGRIFNPLQQNVIWTFLLAFGCMTLLEKAKKRYARVPYCLIAALVALGGFLLGYILFLDYYGAGVLTVLVFYFFRQRNLWNFLLQIVCLYLLHAEVLGGLVYPITVGGFHFEIVQQSLAVLALIPIWLYRGERGYHAPWLRWFCYLFYPVHMMVLYLCMLLF